MNPEHDKQKNNKFGNKTQKINVNAHENSFFASVPELFRQPGILDSIGIVSDGFRQWRIDTSESRYFDTLKHTLDCTPVL